MIIGTRLILGASVLSDPVLRIVALKDDVLRARLVRDHGHDRAGAAPRAFVRPCVWRHPGVRVRK